MGKRTARAQRAEMIARLGSIQDSLDEVVMQLVAHGHGEPHDQPRALVDVVPCATEASDLGFEASEGAEKRFDLRPLEFHEAIGLIWGAVLSEHLLSSSDLRESSRGDRSGVSDDVGKVVRSGRSHGSSSSAGQSGATTSAVGGDESAGNASSGVPTVGEPTDIAQDVSPPSGRVGGATSAGDASPASPADVERPEVVVVLGGSPRSVSEIDAEVRRLTLAGAIVLAPVVFGHDGDAVTDEQKTRLVELHLRKIDLADRVVVIAPGRYVGESTAREIAYALRTGKPLASAPHPLDDLPNLARP